MVYGYARISPNKQNIGRRIRNIHDRYPNARIFQDIYTGAKFYGRKGPGQLLRVVKPGDTIIFDEVSRMSRNADEGVDLYMDLYAKGVTLELIKEPCINTDTYKQAAGKKTALDVKTGDADTDALIAGITENINQYISRLEKKQIRIAFERVQAEVEYLHKTTSKGIRAAQAAGKQVGSLKGSRKTIKKSIGKKKEIRKYNKAFGGALNDKDTIRLIRISRGAHL